MSRSSSSTPDKRKSPGVMEAQVRNILTKAARRLHICLALVQAAQDVEVWTVFWIRSGGTSHER